MRLKKLANTQQLQNSIKASSLVNKKENGLNLLESIDDGN